MTVLLLLAGLALSSAHADEATQIHQQLIALRAQRLAPGPPQVTVGQVRAALGGTTVTDLEMVEGVKAAKGYGLKVYDLPVAALWKAVVDERHHANYLPVQVSKVIRGDPTQTGRTIFQYIDLPVVSDRWWTVMLTPEASEPDRRAPCAAPSRPPCCAVRRGKRAATAQGRDRGGRCARGWSAFL